MNTTEIIDCWNKIGVWGKESPRCKDLEVLMHCINCPVYSEAGRQLLDRESDPEYIRQWTASLCKNRTSNTEKKHTALAFRIGAEWFAIQTKFVQEIIQCDKHHSLPHRKTPVLRGIVNVKGDLLLSVSLGYLFNIQRNDATEQGKLHIHERYIVIRDEEDIFAFPASEVRNILRYEPDNLKKPPATISGASSSFLQGMFKHNDTDIGLLEGELLFNALRRSV